MTSSHARAKRHRAHPKSTEARFGLRIPPCAKAREVARCVADAERVGFDIAWLPDSQFLWRDVWASLALAAELTEGIALGSCVTNLETRHPSVSAVAAVTSEGENSSLIP